MKTLFWLAVFLAVGVVVFVARHLWRKHADRERAAQARAAEFLAQAARAAVEAQKKSIQP